MNMYVGLTDGDWYEQLKQANADEVNFWKPGLTPFRALNENELFLFKLHSPNNYIVGGGFFVRFTQLPTFLAWEAFGEKNGVKSIEEFDNRIRKYRSNNGINTNPDIGCIILTDCFWFDKDDWIPVPSNWKSNIVSGRKYGDDEYGRALFSSVTERLSSKRASAGPLIGTTGDRYANYTAKHRLGQGAFRVLVTDAYQRRCAITGEKTLPVLEAAHIQSYACHGPHDVRNGVLLKSDFHTLFDSGYLTITPDYHIEVSRHLHDDYGNGKDYYKYHGKKLLILPQDISQQPDIEYLEWHNNNIYLG